MPPARQPAPQPVAPTGGSTAFATSGSLPASGVEGTFSGPWCIEEQQMNIQYWRVPSFSLSTVETCDLSSLSTVYNPAYGTSLRFFVQASYTKQYAHGNYATSGWQQTQKFEVFTFSSLHGTSYGDINASSLGPAGNIATTRPFYRRTAWDNAVHGNPNQDVSAQACDAANFAVIASGISWNGQVYATTYDQKDWEYNLQDFATVNRWEGGLLADTDPMPWGALPPKKNLPGQYNTSMEYGNNESFINAVGNYLGYGGGSPAANALNSGFYYSVPATTIDTADGRFLGQTDDGCLGYASYRHDFINP